MIPDVVFLLYFARFESAKKRSEIAKNPNLKVKIKCVSHTLCHILYVIYSHTVCDLLNSSFSIKVFNDLRYQKKFERNTKNQNMLTRKRRLFICGEEVSDRFSGMQKLQKLSPFARYQNF